MVAGDHDRRDAGSAGGLDRRRGALPWRIGHGHEAVERQLAFQRLGREIARDALATRDGEDAVAVGSGGVGSDPDRSHVVGP